MKLPNLHTLRFLHTITEKRETTAAEVKQAACEFILQSEQKTYSLEV
jgi:hypothetical protein